MPCHIVQIPSLILFDKLVVLNECPRSVSQIDCLGAEVCRKGDSAHGN